MVLYGRTFTLLKKSTSILLLNLLIILKFIDFFSILYAYKHSLEASMSHQLPKQAFHICGRLFSVFFLLHVKW